MIGDNQIHSQVRVDVDPLLPPYFALYTRPRHEKTIARRLAERCIECFLPEYQKLSRWKDRNRLVSLPLFPSYVFVRLNWKDRLRVLQLPGVVRFVGFGATPAIVPEAEVQALRCAVGLGKDMGPYRYLKAGRRVRVCHGPLQGTEGILVRTKGVHRLVLSIDLIQRAIAVEVDAADVAPIAESGLLHAGGISSSLSIYSPRLGS